MTGERGSHQHNPGVERAEAEGSGWRAEAKCRGMDPAIFFPPRGDKDGVSREAKAACETCPVRFECLAAGVGELGIWGGLSTQAREKLAGVRFNTVAGPMRANTAACGSQSGYNRHLRSSEKPCASCTEANRSAHQRQRAARG